MTFYEKTCIFNCNNVFVVLFILSFISLKFSHDSKCWMHCKKLVSSVFCFPIKKILETEKVDIKFCILRN